MIAVNWEIMHYKDCCFPPITQRQAVISRIHFTLHVHTCTYQKANIQQMHAPAHAWACISWMRMRLWDMNALPCRRNPVPRFAWAPGEPHFFVGSRMNMPGSHARALLVGTSTPVSKPGSHAFHSNRGRSPAILDFPCLYDNGTSFTHVCTVQFLGPKNLSVTSIRSLSNQFAYWFYDLLNNEISGIMCVGFRLVIGCNSLAVPHIYSGHTSLYCWWTTAPERYAAESPFHSNILSGLWV
jgi:hypothetical protein